MIICLAIAYGDIDNFPSFNPQGLPISQALATTALLTMWAFIGIEAAVIPTVDVKNPKKIIPIAVVSAALSVSFLYVGASTAVMFLVPSDILVVSESPFVDAAAHIGTGGALLIAKNNRGGAPAGLLLVYSVLSTGLLALNFADGLIGAFSFLISMSTLSILAPYGLSAMAEFKRSWRSAKGWAGVALLAVICTLIAIAGSGLYILLLGVGLFLLGIPLFKVFRRTTEATKETLIR